MLKKVSHIVLIIMISLFLFNKNVFAASTATMSWSGGSTVTPGSTIKVDIVTSAPSGSNLTAAQGQVSVTDTSCLTLTKIEKVSATNVGAAKVAYSDTDGTSSALTLAHVTFTAGSNPCTTTVKVSGIGLAFEDGTKLKPADISKTITVQAATPSKSSVKTLKSLVPSTGTLSPTFNSDTTSYTMEFDTLPSSINFTATPTDSKATVTGTSCTISGSPTVCKVTVKAEDGSTKSYSVTVSKKTSSSTPTPTPTETKSSDATLKSLDVSGYTLSPKFSKTTTTYTMSVKNNVTSLDVDAIATDSKATVKITGNKNWKVGVNPIKITVTAEDGTTKVYTVNVTRKEDTSKPDVAPKTEDEKSSDNYLKDIVISDGVLEGGFKKNVTEYNMTVPYDVTSLDLSAFPSSDKATVKIIGNKNFKVGEVNTVTIDVTAEDGSLRTYTINVTRSEKKANNLLDDLIVEEGDLDPEFDPDKTEYTIDVPSNIDKLNIKAFTKNPKSKVQIIGNENLKEGKNKISVIVTDENGFSKVYTLYAYKSAKKKLFNFSLIEWIIIGLILLGLLWLLLLLLLKRRKKEEEKSQTIIEFKPEINVGSKNGTDDDIVQDGGILNQYAAPQKEEQPKAIEEKVEPQVVEQPKEEIKVLGLSSKEQEAEYDLYDDVVTKEELIDAIRIANETKDPSILNMLLAQEKLNQEKAKLIEQESQLDEQEEKLEKAKEEIKKKSTKTTKSTKSTKTTKSKTK